MPPVFPTIQDARSFARLGLRPLWLNPPHSAGRGAGKTPLEQGWNYAKWIHSDEVGPPPGPGCNIGVCTGDVEGAPLAIVAVNIDSATLVVWAEAKLPHPRVKILTERGELWVYPHPRGGVRVPPGSKVTGSGIQIIGDHGQIVVPPSTSASGHVYTLVGSWHDLRTAEPFDVALIEERTTEQDTFTDIVENLPRTKEAFSWLGNFSHRSGITQVMRARISDPAMAAHFDAGVQVGSVGHRLARPQEVADAVRKRIQRAIDSPKKAKAILVEELEFRIFKLIRRPIMDRAQFEVVLEGNNRPEERIPVRVPDGRTLNSYALMRGLAAEAGFYMPPGSKEANLGWAEAVKTAWSAMEVEPIDPEEAAATACREIISREVFNASAELATSKAEMGTGKLARFGDYMAILPEILIKSVRKHLHEDRLERSVIVRAARSIGLHEMFPDFPDGKVRVWAFPMTIDESEGPDDPGPDQPILFPTSPKPAS